MLPYTLTRMKTENKRKLSVRTLMFWPKNVSMKLKRVRLWQFLSHAMTNGRQEDLCKTFVKEIIDEC